MASISEASASRRRPAGMMARPKRSSASPTAEKNRLAARAVGDPAFNGRGWQWAHELGNDVGIQHDHCSVLTRTKAAGALAGARGNLQFHAAEGRKAGTNGPGEVFGACFPFDGFAQDQARFLFHRTAIRRCLNAKPGLQSRSTSSPRLRIVMLAMAMPPLCLQSASNLSYDCNAIKVLPESHVLGCRSCNSGVMVKTDLAVI